MREVTFPAVPLTDRSVIHARAPIRPDVAATHRIGHGMNAYAHQEEIGHAQVAARAENEAIQASANKLAILGPVPFVCECASRDCAEIVRLSFDEYEAVRQYPCRFFNVSGHETTSVEAGAERIIAVAGELTVVEKVGVAGDIATEAHERPA